MTVRVILEGGPCDGQVLALEDAGPLLDVLYLPPRPITDPIRVDGVDEREVLTYAAVTWPSGRPRTDTAARLRYAWRPLEPPT